jgi:hypothetical protein
MNKSQTGLLFSLLALGACSSNSTPGNKRTNDSTAVNTKKPEIAAIKDSILGKWAGKNEGENDTLEIGKVYISDKGEGTKWKYIISNDSITIYGDSTYTGKISISSNSLTITDTKESTMLTRVK